MENTLNALQFTIYPSLEALSCFGFISEGVEDMKYIVLTHMFLIIIGLVGFATRRNTLFLDY